MVKRGPTNPITIGTARELRKTRAGIWRRAAEILEKPTKIRAEANLSEISRVAEKTKETIVVPGKVLGNGELSGKFTISAQAISASALAKIKRAGGKFMYIDELAKENPKGTGLRLMI